MQTMESQDEMRWWRGNFHAHSFWSDGRAFPEEAVQWYMMHGWHFLCLSDHNTFQDNPCRWIAETGRERCFADYIAVFRDAQTRMAEGGIREARLSTFEELASRFDEPGRFILLPGAEATRSIQYLNGVRREIHMNYAGIPKLLPSIASPDFAYRENDTPLSEFISRHAKETDALAKSLGIGKHVFMLNHPVWQWYDIPPETLAGCPGVRFFEVCNNGTDFAPPADGLSDDGFDTDRFWDVANAFRMRRGLPPIYGIGGDDTHFYRGEVRRMLMPGNAWTLVRSRSLNSDSLFAAMHAGDFVACEGLEPEDVRFDPASGTLSVSVAAKPGAVRTIRFIVTKRDFDEKPIRTVTVRPSADAESNAHERKIAIYGDEIGRVVKTVFSTSGEALSASYTLKPDDLYVRARIEEPGRPLCNAWLHPQGRLVAWTQPYAAKGI